MVRATPDDASILGIERGSPCCRSPGSPRSADGTPFEYSHDLFRADRTRIVVHTAEPGGDTDADLARQSFELITH